MGLLDASAINPILAEDDTLKAKLVRGDLVPRNFESGNCITDDSFNATQGFVTGVHNKDGTGAGLNVIVPTTPATPNVGGWRLQQNFFGRAFGIRFRRTNTTPEFCVRIDGVAHGVDPTLLKAKVYNQVIEDEMSQVLIADNLPEGEHLAEITVVAPAAGQSSILFFGYLVEKRAGYVATASSDCAVVNGVNVPAPGDAAGAQIIYDCMTSVQGVGNARRVSRIHYHNTTGADVVVTIKNNGITYEELAITNTKSADLVFNPPMALNSLWTHASPGGGVLGVGLPYWVFGSF